MRGVLFEFYLKKRVGVGAASICSLVLMKKAYFPPNWAEVRKRGRENYAFKCGVMLFGVVRKEFGSESVRPVRKGVLGKYEARLMKNTVLSFLLCAVLAVELFAKPEMDPIWRKSMLLRQRVYPIVLDPSSGLAKAASDLWEEAKKNERHPLNLLITSHDAPSCFTEEAAKKLGIDAIVSEADRSEVFAVRTTWNIQKQVAADIQREKLQQLEIEQSQSRNKVVTAAEAMRIVHERLQAEQQPRNDEQQEQEQLSARQARAQRQIRSDLDDAKRKLDWIEWREMNRKIGIRVD